MIDKINIGAGKFRKDGWTNIDHMSDHYHKNRIDFDIDLLTDFVFPFELESISAAYCSHVVEHLPVASVARMLEQIYHVMVPGGIFRITCPDARAAFDALKAGNEEFFNIYNSSVCFNENDPMQRYHLTGPLRDASIYQKFLYFLAPQRCMLVDVPCRKVSDEEMKSVVCYYYTRALDDITGQIDDSVRANNPWMHVSWWSIDKLGTYLSAAGFKTFYQSEPGLSQCKEMRDLHYFDWALPRLSLYIEAVK